MNPPAPRTLAIALSLASFVATATAGAQSPAGCIVRTNAADAYVAVPMPGPMGSTRVSITNAPFSARMPTVTGGEFQVVALGALAFSGTTNEVPMHLAGPVRSTGGVLYAPAGAVVTRERQGPAGAIITVDLATDVRAVELDVPCDALGVRPARTTAATPVAPATPAVPSTPAGAAVASDGRRWSPSTPTRFALYAAPDGTGPAVYVSATPVSISFYRTATAGAWWRVAWAAPNGATLEGWMRRRDLRAVPPRWLHGRSSSTTCGGMGSRRVHAPTVAGVYRGVASVRAGQAVYAARGGVGAWATVRDGAGLVVAHAQGDDWVQVIEIPGVDEGHCGEHVCSAWVPRASVSFPAEAGRR